MRKKQCVFCFYLSAILILFGAALSGYADTAPPASPVKLIFIHHSTGGNWLADPNADQPYGGLGAALMQNNYYVSATNYGWGPDGAGIGDRTDIPNWPEWFTGPDSQAILAALFNETGQNFQEYGAWPRLNADPGGPNAIVLFKSCFPNSDLFGQPADPPAANPNQQFTVSNAKAVYNQILTSFAQHRDKLFVAITAPPQTENGYGEDYQTPAQRAANARAFNNWLLHDWLRDYPYDNVAVFDYYNVLTGADNHHRWQDGSIVHQVATAYNFSAYPSDPWNSHPNTTGQQKATQEFVPLLNHFYNLWQADSPAPTPTPVPTPVPTPEPQVAPLIGILANGAKPVAPVDTDTPVTLSLSLAAGGYAGVDCDWWLVHLSPSGGVSSFDLRAMDFVEGFFPVVQAGLLDLPLVPITTLASLELGAHYFFFGVDSVMNAALLENEPLYLDYVIVQVSDALPGNRLQPDELVYQGAFAFPAGDDWGYGGLAMAYYPAADSEGKDAFPGGLYVTGNAQNDRVGLISIPTPQATADFSQLPRATVLLPLTDITGGLIDNFTTADCGYRDVFNLDGLAYVAAIDKVVWNVKDWFNTGACDNDSLGWSDPDLSGAQGVWHIGPRPSTDDVFHNAKTCDYLFNAPQHIADQYLGGRSLIAGNHREGGALGGSSGPTLFAVQLPSPAAPPPAGQNLDARALLYYRFRFGCAWDVSGENVIPQPASGACDFEGYRAFDNWSGAVWVESGTDAAILIFGRKGLGDNCYGTQAECADDPCNMYKGYHAYPYAPQILFYDPADVLGVISGAKAPWTIQPYRAYRPETILFNPTCGILGAAAYDATRGLIYAAEQEAGPDGQIAVHVWRIDARTAGFNSHG